MYKVLSKNGFVLGTFDCGTIAMIAFHSWPQAHVVMCGDDVVQRKMF